MTYRELQTALKNLRHAGYDIQVKLNASLEILQAEYLRLTEVKPVDQLEVMTADDFNAWVGLPTETVAIAKDDNRETGATKQPLKQLEAIASRDLTPQPTLAQSDEPKPRVNIGNLQQNEGFSSRQNSETFTEQRFEPIESNIGSSPRTTQPETREYYWVDGSELGQKLSLTQAQAMRNLEDGFKWLIRLPRNFKAFEQGFREGLKNTPIRQRQASSQPQVIPIHSKRGQPIPMAA